MLVIIGLLIGGILVAQSMIASAEVQGYVRKLQQYEAAIQLFKENYRQEPGDSTHFTPPGNGDGIINQSNCHSTAPYSAYEKYNIWPHLSQSKMLDLDLVPWQPGGCGGTHSNGWADEAGIVSPVFTETEYWPLAGISSDNPNKVPMDYEQIGGTTARYFETHIEPLDSLGLDNKIDDGDSSTGDFISDELVYVGDYCDVYVGSGATLETLCTIYWYPDGQ